MIASILLTLIGAFTLVTPLTAGLSTRQAIENLYESRSTATTVSAGKNYNGGINAAWDSLMGQVTDVIAHLKTSTKTNELTATALTINVSPSTATVRQMFTISGKLTNATNGAPITGEIIHLQKNINGTWTDSSRKSITDTGGSYNISMSEGTAGIYEYRTTYTGHLTYACTNSTSVVVTVQQPTYLTAAAYPPTVLMGQTSIIYGYLTTVDGAPILGETIQLQKNINGTWTDVNGGKNTTATRGLYTISVNEETAGIYEYRTTYPGRSTYIGNYSTSVLVTVQQPTQLTATANSSIVPIGQTFTVYGSLTTANGSPIFGETIQLQKYIDATWTDVTGATGITGTGGSYSISMSEGTPGIYEYRATYLGRSTYAGTNSTSVALTIKPSTHLTAAEYPPTVLIGQTFTVYGYLTTTSGVPMSGETIQLQKNINGTWTDVSGDKNTTADRGLYTISVNEGTAGIYEYRTNYTGRATYAGNYSTSVVVTVQQPTQLTVTTSLPTVALGQTFTIYGSLTSTNGSPISGETIQLQKNINGTWTDTGIKNTTNVEGFYSISTSEGTAGIYEYRITYPGRSTYAGTNSTSISVAVKPATYLTAAANPSTVLIGQTFTVYGYLTTTNGSPMSGETIQLQKNINGTWTDVNGGKNTTATRGLYTISVNEGTAGIYEYRTNYTGNINYAGNYSTSVAVTVQQPTQLTAAANPSTVPIGEIFTIYGSLTTSSGAPMPGETVQLQKNISGKWTDVTGASGMTGTGGSYSISASEGTAGNYEYRTTYPGRSTYAGTSSASVLVPVKPATQLTIAANPSTVALGQTFTIYGSLTTTNASPMTGETIQLQKYINSTWTDVIGVTDTTSTGGSYSFSTSEGTAGSYEYRTNYAGNITYAGNYSIPVVVNVKSPTQLTPTHLTAFANPSTVDSGWYFNINGALNNPTDGDPITGAVIQLQKNLSGMWNDINGRKTTTTIDGSYSITYSEGSYGSYDFRTVYSGNGTYAASDSPIVTITVQTIPPPNKTKTQLTISASPTTVNNKTQQITFTGVLSAQFADMPDQTLSDQTVMLQRNVSGLWTTVDQKTTDSSGSVSFMRTEAINGTYHYRLYYAGSDTYAASKSDEVTIVSTVGPNALASLGALVAIVIIWGYVRRRRLG